MAFRIVDAKPGALDSLCKNNILELHIHTFYSKQLHGHSSTKERKSNRHWRSQNLHFWVNDSFHFSFEHHHPVAFEYLCICLCLFFLLQTEPEIIEETDVDRLAGRHYLGCGRQIKGQSETSTLSSQPSIDEVRQQMHLLLEEAFSLASAGHSTSSRHHHYHSHHQHPPLGPYGLGPVIPYSEVVTSAPGTTSQGQGGLQWVRAYKPDPYQCSLAKQVQLWFCH